MQDGNLSRINKDAGCNKVVQVGFFQQLVVKNHKNWKKFQKLINMLEIIRPSMLDFFKKLIICVARLLNTLRVCCQTVRMYNLPYPQPIGFK